MALIMWDSDFSVGVDRLDADHIVLISLINHIHEVGQSASDETAMARILEVLIEQARTHFRREEELLEKWDYPDLDAHIKHHQILMEQLKELHQECLRYHGAETIEEIIKLLGLWLEEHILKVDKRYRPFLERKSGAVQS